MKKRGLRLRLHILRPQFQNTFVALVFCLLGLVSSFGDSITPAKPVLSQAASDKVVRHPLFEKLDPLTFDSIDCAARSCVSLTFDDGPDATVTPKILETLLKYHVRASFFVTGNHTAAYPRVVKTIYDQGHDVENHSWDHADFKKLSGVQMDEEIKKTQDAVTAAGVPAPTMFRPPYGRRNQAIRDRVGLPTVLWNVDPRDWNDKDPYKIAENVISTVKPGSIIIMHATHDPTAAALPQIIEALHAAQYQLVPLTQLLPAELVPNGEYMSRP